ncbi:NB-ARC domain-containing protein [Mycena venus]|uniref:NB-ARC domain-containing protein n=1 Tax=Mycena venus TaxID=2733690 RepID=A0A8H6XPH4_9AGAR|nr:NB-ARC domain-containing protein [Mycena venus]
MPLDQAAARQTFIEIADEIHDGSEVDQLLEITDNIPLAAQLVAGIAASVGCQDTIHRWNLERTGLLSAGFDKRSNLEISISLSLSSPRLQSSPHAVDLLSLMSILSDGISDLDLVQSNIPIPDIPKCKTTLVRTSLAYVDHAGRLKVLAPIREYIQLARPPPLQLVRPLRKYLIDLLKLYVAWWDASSFAIDLVRHLVSNLGNLHSVLKQGLDSDDIDLRETILGIIMLNDLTLTMNRGLTPLMLHLPDILSRIDDHKLHGQFITEAFESSEFYTLPNPEMAIDNATEHFRLIQDPEGEARLYDAVASYYIECAGDPKKGEEFFLRALSVASQSNSNTAKLRPLSGLGLMNWRRGNYSRGLELAQEIHRIARASGNVRAELQGIRLHVLCSLSLGHFNHSVQLLNEGKELIVQAGLQGGHIESALMNIEAHLYALKTEYSNERHIQEAILRSTSAVLSPIAHAEALLNIAFLDIITGASADVVSRNLDAATTLFETAQYLRGRSFCEYCHANLLFREGDMTRARLEYIRIFASARGNEEELGYNCLARLADPTNPLHADTESARWAVVFLALALRPVVRSPLTVHRALRRLGDVLAQQGEDDTALSILTVALDRFTQMDVHQSKAECMSTMGDVYMRRGDLSRAKELWEGARPLFERSEQKKEVVRIDEKLQTLGVAQKLHDISKGQLPIHQAALQDPGGNSEAQKPLSISAQ